MVKAFPGCYLLPHDARLPRSRMSSVAKVFDVLDLFSLETPVLRVEDIGQRLGYTRASAYRYVRDLCDAGLLAPAGSGAYALGPRVLELERLLRLTDPLLRASQLVLARMRPAVARGGGVLLVCSLYRDRVLCIHQEGAERLTAGGRIIPIQRVRGLPMPLFRGAASLAILAHLPPRQARALHARQSEAIAQAGLGGSWAAFRARLAGIRQAGHAVSSGQMDPDLSALSAPILLPGEGPAAAPQLLGSLTRVMTRDDFERAEPREMARDLVHGAEQIAVAVAAGSLPAAEPERLGVVPGA
jgi:DNA-binding IclR family transcriptional regulator